MLPTPRTLSHIAVSFEITASSSSYAVPAALEEKFRPHLVAGEVWMHENLVDEARRLWEEMASDLASS